MSFIFRTIFWLALAVVVVPPEARMGGHDTADFRDMDVGLELHNAAYTAWSMASASMQACNANPQLCKAATDLWQTTWQTVGELATSAPENFEVESREISTAEAKPYTNPQ